MSKDNGGPAFPGSQYANGISPSGHSEGLSLRDYFAAKAMQAFIAGDYRSFPELACDAYVMADAMLAERAK